jgi:hypothetical protein
MWRDDFSSISFPEVIDGDPLNAMRALGVEKTETEHEDNQRPGR